ncbi:MAG: MFS transporter [Pseudonocardiales bacterium]
MSQGRLRGATLRPFAHPAFRMLFAGRFVSFVGNAMAPIALAFAVLDLTGSVRDLGLVLACRSVPQLVLLLFGGVFADRLPRHLVIVASNLISGTSQAVVAVLLLTGTADLWQLAALEAVNGASSAFLFPAAAGLTPQTVPPALLQQANSFLRLGLNTASIAGAGVGGILVAAAGPGWALAVDSATFFAGAAFLALIRLPRGMRLPGGNVLAELRGGWDEFRSREWLWVIVCAFALINMAWTANIAVLGPAVANHTIGRAAWGLVVAAFTAGLLGGGLLSLRLRPQRTLLVGTVASLLVVPFLVVLGLEPAALPLILGAFVGGIGFELFGIYWDLSLQQHVPRDKLSRVSSYDALGSFLFIPAGQLLAGPLVLLVGLRPAIAVSVTVLVIATLAALCSRSVRDLRRTDQLLSGEPGR